MGLLDQFSNMSDDQSQGLLSAGLRMMAASGPSRDPIGFGQIANYGMQGYVGTMADAKKRKREEEQAAQMAQLRGLQMQDLQGQLSDKGLIRNQQARIKADLLAGDGGQQEPQQPPQMPAQPQQMASAMPGGPMSPNIGGPDWMQHYQQQQAKQPEQQPVGNFPGTPPQLGGQQNSTQAYADRLLKEAAIYSKNGDFDGADKRYQAAVKLMPQVDKIEPARDPKSGQLVNVITYKDGTQKVSEFGVKPDMVEMSLGNRKQWLDKNTVASGQKFDVGVSPDTVYSGDITKRGQNLQDLRAAEAGQTPEYKQDADGNWLALPKKIGAGEKITARPVFGTDGNPLAAAPKPLTESQGKATTFAARMTDAESIIRSMESKGVSGSDFGTIAAGGPLTNWMATSSGQQYRQAQENWVTANLRQESGAAIGKDEMDKDVRKFFPVPGDSQEVKNQKTRSRSIATQGMVQQAGPGSKSIAGIVAAGQPDATPAPAAAPTMAAMPTPNASNRGRILIDHDTGKRYRSSGLQWQEVK